MMMKRAVLMTVIGLGFLAACMPTINRGVKSQINMNHEEWLAIHLKPLEELDVKYLLSEEGLKCYFPQPIRKTYNLDRAAKVADHIPGAVATLEAAREEMKKLPPLSGRRNFIERILLTPAIYPVLMKPEIKLIEVKEVWVKENGRAAVTNATISVRGETRDIAPYLRYTALPSGWRHCLVPEWSGKDIPHYDVAYWIQYVAPIAEFWDRPLDEALKAYYDRLMGR